MAPRSRDRVAELLGELGMLQANRSFSAAEI